MTSSITPRRSGLLLTSILSAVAVMAVGCGGSGKSATTTSAAATSADMEVGLSRWFVVWFVGCRVWGAGGAARAEGPVWSTAGSD